MNTIIVRTAMNTIIVRTAMNTIIVRTAMKNILPKEDQFCDRNLETSESFKTL